MQLRCLQLKIPPCGRLARSHNGRCHGGKEPIALLSVHPGGKLTCWVGGSCGPIIRPDVFFQRFLRSLTVGKADHSGYARSHLANATTSVEVRANVDKKQKERQKDYKRGATVSVAKAPRAGNNDAMRKAEKDACIHGQASSCIGG